MSYGMQKDRQLPLSGLIDKSHDKQKNSHILINNKRPLGTDTGGYHLSIEELPEYHNQ